MKSANRKTKVIGIKEKLRYQHERGQKEMEVARSEGNISEWNRERVGSHI